MEESCEQSNSPYQCHSAKDNCGCQRHKRLGRNRKSSGIAARNYVLSYYKSNAKHKGLSFNLKNEEAFKMFEQPCYYCGRKPSTIAFRKGLNGSFIYNGIDRKNPQFGYFKFNVVTCCQVCNFMKNSYTQTEFLEVITMIANNRGL